MAVKVLGDLDRWTSGVWALVLTVNLNSLFMLLGPFPRNGARPGGSSKVEGDLWANAHSFIPAHSIPSSVHSFRIFRIPFEGFLMTRYWQSRCLLRAPGTADIWT